MTLQPIPPGMKIAAQITPEPTDVDLKWLKQMGLDYVVLWTGGDKSSYEYYASRPIVSRDEREAMNVGHPH